MEVWKSDVRGGGSLKSQSSKLRITGPNFEIPEGLGGALSDEIFSTGRVWIFEIELTEFLFSMITS